MGGDLKSRCVDRVYDAYGDRATFTLLHQVGISHHFMRNMHGQTTLKLL